MSLVCKEKHLDCPYYATLEQSIFRLHTLNAGKNVSDINRSNNFLLYLIEGELEFTLGRFGTQRIGAGTLLFVPKKICFYGHALGKCEIVSCTVTEQPSLCDRYTLTDLQRDIRQGGGNLYRSFL